MPYAGNVYTLPPGTEASTLTAIDSSDYNSFIADIEAAQNTARPVIAGGTGGTSVITAWDGLAKKGADIATASSVNLTTATGPSLSFTGTVTVTAVTLAEGSFRLVRAAAAFQITASASLLCNGSATVNMAVAAEDILLFRGGASSVVSVVRLGSLAPLFTSIDLGNADTTLTRDSAGVMAVEGVPLYSNIPQNSKSAAYTTVLADAQKHILHPAADNNARTFTIDSNANVAYPIGTAITFVNEINTVTIAITSDTLVLAGAGTTGSRSLAANGMATAIKITATKWMISGSGLT